MEDFLGVPDEPPQVDWHRPGGLPAGDDALAEQPAIVQDVVVFHLEQLARFVAGADIFDDVRVHIVLAVVGSVRLMAVLLLHLPIVPPQGVYLL